MSENSIVDQALADRGDGGACNMPRIPTGRFPPFSTTLFGTFDANGEATLTFRAERDTLFFNLTVDGTDLTDPIDVTAEYCNTKYLIRSPAITWLRCCDRKPVFLVGVRDNKELVFTFTGGTATDAINVTLSGFQGNGCCG